MKLARKAGSNSQIWQIFIRDSSSTTGGGLTGLAYNSASLSAFGHRDLDVAATTISLVTMTLGVFTSGGFKEIDATNMPGFYAFCPPDALLAGGSSCAFMLKGAANMVPLAIEVDLDAQVDATHLLGTAIATPATAGVLDVNVKKINNATAATPGAAGGVLIAGTNVATGFSSLVVNGTTTLTGSFQVLAGLVVSNSAPNGNAITLTGSGTGHGIITTGGATGNGFYALGGATSGSGFRVLAQGGNSNGCSFVGFGTGAGIGMTGGATGVGAKFTGGATSGPAVWLTSQSNSVNVSTDSNGNGNFPIGINNDALDQLIDFFSLVDPDGNYGGTVATVTNVTNSGGGITAEDLWTYANRTLTSGVATVIRPWQTGSISIIKGDSYLHADGTELIIVKGSTAVWPSDLFSAGDYVITFTCSPTDKTLHDVQAAAGFAVTTGVVTDATTVRLGDWSHAVTDGLSIPNGNGANAYAYTVKASRLSGVRVHTLEEGTMTVGA